MKKILLLCLAALLLMQGVCLAKIEKGSDNFEGTYWYFVDHSLSDLEFSYLRVSFITFFNSDKLYDGTGLRIAFTKDNGYAIANTIKVQIDDTIYTWQTTSNSTRSAFVGRSFPIPDDVFAALMKTKNNIAIRFYFSALSGDYAKDFVVPKKKIKEVQTMFNKYIPKTEPMAQPAK